MNPDSDPSSQNFGPSNDREQASLASLASLDCSFEKVMHARVSVTETRIHVGPVFG